MSSRLSVRLHGNLVLDESLMVPYCGNLGHTSSSFVNIVFILFSFFKQVVQIQSGPWCVFCVSWSRMLLISVRAKYLLLILIWYERLFELGGHIAFGWQIQIYGQKAAYRSLQKPSVQRKMNLKCLRREKIMKMSEDHRRHSKQKLFAWLYVDNWLWILLPKFQLVINDFMPTKVL